MNTNDRPNSWKVVVVGPTGPTLDGSAFGVLYSFPTREEAEGHAACFSKTGTEYTLCEVLAQPLRKSAWDFQSYSH